MLWRPQFPRLFSVFFMASNVDEAAWLFVLAFVCFACLGLGWRTRTSHVLSLVMTTSLHNRILFAENWGAVALGTIMIWTAFLPLGRRWSVDALLASLRTGRDETPADLAAKRLPPPDNRPAVSLACFAILLQIAVIYGFNFAHKSGVTWRQGTAVHYVLNQERIVTTLGVWVREHAPFAFTRAMTYGTLVIEGIAPVLVLAPFFRRWLRALAALLLTGLHGGIALLVNLGSFSAVMIAYYPLLLDGALWDALARRRGPPKEKALAFYDAGCGMCFRVVRVLARLDAFGRVRWIPNTDRELLPADVDPGLLETTLLVVDAEPRRAGAPLRRWTRSDAIARVVSLLPGGALVAWVLRVPGLRALAGRAYDAVARSRGEISAWFGLDACGVPASKPAWSPSSPSFGLETPARRWAHRALSIGRELGVAFAVFVLGADALVSNGAVPQALRWEGRPKWMAEILMYPHVFESWSLFAPEAPRGDEMVVVDAVTVDGRHVDPFNEIGSRVHSLPVNDIPVRLGHDSMFCDYSLRIPGEGAYHPAFQDWILRYPQRTGRREDTIVSFEAVKLEHASPGPGQRHPSDVKRHVFLKYPSTAR